MPNHCENDLYLSGSSEDVAAVLALIGADQTPPTFDFNALIPYPEPFKSMDADHNAIPDYPRRDDPEYTTKKAALDEALAAYEAKWGTRSDGYNSGGFEWTRQAWGTKWGAYDVARRDYGGQVCVTYQTAWAPSQTIIVALAQRFPAVTFSLEYFEHGMAFAGGFTCHSEGDHYDDEPWKPGTIADEWHIEGYKGHRGG